MIHICNVKTNEQNHERLSERNNSYGPLSKKSLIEVLQNYNVNTAKGRYEIHKLLFDKKMVPLVESMRT